MDFDIRMIIMKRQEKKSPKEGKTKTNKKRTIDLINSFYSIWKDQKYKKKSEKREREIEREVYEIEISNVSQEVKVLII